jgi:hypothetical protein
VAYQSGCSEAKPVEKLTVIDDQVPQLVQRVDSIRISTTGPGMSWGVNAMSARKLVEKLAIA